MTAESNIPTTDIHSLIEGWRQHSEKPECLPTCLYNILFDLSNEGEKLNGILPISIQKTKGICGYTPESGSAWDKTKKGIESKLRRNHVMDWEIRHKEGRGKDLDHLYKVLSDPNSSYPVLNLGPEYLSERYNAPLEGPPHSWFDHCVVGLECLEDRVVIYDPYNPFKMCYFNPVYELDRNTFLRYWVSADPAKGIMWLQRVSRTLEHFMEVR